MLGQVGWNRTLKTALLLAVLALGCFGAAGASAGWLGVGNLAPSNAPNQSVGSPSVAMARDGTTFAAFQHYDGAHFRTGVVMRGPGGGFGGVRDLSDATDDASSAVIAVDRQGNATVAWFNTAAGNTVTIKARFRPAGGDWGAIQTLSSTGIWFNPRIATGDNGAAVVVWWRQIAAGPLTVQVEAAVRPAGAQTLGAALPVSTSTPGSQPCLEPRVAMDAAGDVAAIWTRRLPDGSAYPVESNVKAAGAAAFAGPEMRSAATGSSPCNTDIQMTPGGRTTAMWDFGGAGTTFVEYADRSTNPFAAGTWGPRTKASSSTDETRAPEFAIDDAGNTAAAWLLGVFSTSQQVIASVVRTGLGGFSPEKPLTGPGNPNDKSVAASPNGDAIVVFGGMSNNNSAIFGARRQAGGPFDDPVPIVVTPPGGAAHVNSADVALDDQGNAFAVWNRDETVGVTSISTAQFAGFDPVPPAITAADVPGTGVAGQAVGMSAAATDRMSGASIHFDFGDGTGADGTDLQHIYGAPGAFTVRITATDGGGNQSSTTRAIQVSPAPGPAPAGPSVAGVRRVAAVTALSWDRLSNGRTRLKALRVERLEGPEVVRLACIGKTKGCRKAATRTDRKHGKTLNLTKYIAGMTLRPKAQLTVTVTRPGYIARIFRYTMVKRRDPKKLSRCLAPGQKKSTVC